MRYKGKDPAAWAKSEAHRMAERVVARVQAGNLDGAEDEVRIFAQEIAHLNQAFRVLPRQCGLVQWPE